MGSREIKAGKAWLEILAKANLSAGLSAAGKQIRAWGQNLAAQGAGITAIGAAIGGPLLLATKHFASAGSDLDDMAQRTGASASALSELGYAAALSGTDLATVEGALAKWQKRLAEARANGGQDLADLGLDLEQLGRLSPTEQLAAVADVLAQTTDPAQRTALAIDLLGKSGAQLIPLLSGGSAGLADMAAEAHRLGLVMSDQDAAAAAELGDKFDQLGLLTAGLQNKIGSALAPALTDAAERLVELGADAVQFVDQNRGLVVAAGATAAGLVTVGAAVTGLGLTVSLVGAGLSGLGAGLAAVVSPLGLTTAALAGGVYAWGTYTDAGQRTVATLKTGFVDLQATGQTTLAAVADALAAGDLALAGTAAMAGLKVAWIQGLQGLEAVTGPAVADIAQAFTSGEFSQAASLAWQDISTAAEIAALESAAVWEDFATGSALLWDDFTNQALAAYETITQRGAAWLQSQPGQQLQHLAAQQLGTFLFGDSAEGRVAATLLQGGIGATVNTAAAGINTGTAANAKSRAAAAEQAATQRAASLNARLAALQARRDQLAADLAKPNSALAAGRSATALAVAQAELDEARQAAAAAAAEAERRRNQGQEDQNDETAGPLGRLSAGTFSAQAAQLLGLGGGKAQQVQEEIADNTAEAVEALKEFNRRPAPDVMPNLAWEP